MPWELFWSLKQAPSLTLASTGVRTQPLHPVDIALQACEGGTVGVPKGGAAEGFLNLQTQIEQ